MKLVESNLQTLYRLLKDLLKETAILNDEEIESQLYEVIRSMLISNLFIDKNIITITGLQGVGKTTLLKQIYGLGNEFVENLDRGECFPILFVENSDAETKYYVHYIVSQEKKIYKEEISKKAFFEGVQANSLYNLLYEVSLPEKVFKNQHSAFLLLPGFEEINENNKSFQKLIEHLLNISTVPIIVFNQSEYADDANRQLLSRVKRIAGDVQPIYILSFSDASEDNNLSFKQQIISELKLNNSDRVVRTGTDSFGIAKWGNDFRKAVNSIEKKSFSIKKEHTDSILNMINKISKIIMKIETKVDSEKLHRMYDDLLIDDYMNVFHSQVGSIRKRYTQLLEKSLLQFSMKVKSDITNGIVEYGLLKKIQNAIIGENLKKKLNLITIF